MTTYKLTYFARKKGAQGISYLHTMEVELSDPNDFTEIRNAVDGQGQEFCIPQKGGLFNVPKTWSQPWVAEKIMNALRWPAVGQEIVSKTGRRYTVTDVNDTRFRMKRDGTESSVTVTKARAIKALELKASGATINPQRDICYTVAIACGVVWCIGGLQ